MSQLAAKLAGREDQFRGVVLHDFAIAERDLAGFDIHREFRRVERLENRRWRSVRGHRTRGVEHKRKQRANQVRFHAIFITRSSTLRKDRREDFIWAWGRALMRRLTRINQAYFAGLAVMEQRTPSDDLDRLARLLAVRAGDVKRVARKYLDLDRCALIVVR